jgi:hypothetical protein
MAHANIFEPLGSLDAIFLLSDCLVVKLVGQQDAPVHVLIKVHAGVADICSVEDEL